MVAVVGRRRVGKTYLTQQVYGDRIVFEATGMQNADKKELLQNFLFRINQTFYEGKAKLHARNWLAAFQLLILALDRQSYQEKKVIFLDELPWFDSHKSGFVRALGFFWNSWCATKDVVVVICGSAASWMIEQVVNLEQIGRICSPPSALSNEFRNLYPALFDEAHRHVAVIRALAEKKKGLTRKEILENTGFTDGGGASKVIQALLYSGFISEYYPYEKTRRDLLYRLTDAYSIFYIAFLEDKRWDGADWWQTFSQTPAFKT